MAETAPGERIWTVREVNFHVHSLIDGDPCLSEISVKGELSNVKHHSSGHIYFTLKDASSAISAVMFSSDAQRVGFKMEAGDEVIIGGRISVYEKTGSYQLYAKSVRRSGIGELYRKFEKLKNELQEMGMFDEMYKKPIPMYIKRLGVVTSSTGAAVRDIINVSRRRNPYIEIILYPAQVQGRGAAESIADGIRTLEDMEVDTIIVGRGGGSIEDLWAFNEEVVARAIFDCSVPIISGTGHETDFTIADMVADLRAPTPSAAAELAVFDFSEFTGSVGVYRDRLISLMNEKIYSSREQAFELKARIVSRSPDAKLKLKRERLKGYKISITGLMERILSERKKKRAVFAETLQALSPLNTLSRGYTFTESSDGIPVKSVNDVKTGDMIKVYTTDGRIFADVRSIEEIRISG